MKIIGKQYIVEVKSSLLKSFAAGAGLAAGAMGIGLATKYAFPTKTPNQPVVKAVAPSTQIPQVPVVKPPSPPVETKAPVSTKPPETKTPPVTNKPEEPVGYEFENPHEKRLYGALISAEHRGHVKDPYKYDPKHYIRTRSGDGTSSAYGPLQITRNTARGFMDPKDPYHGSFVAQGSKMLKSAVDDPTHGLGGSGTLSGPEHHANYQKLAVRVMRGKAKELGVDISKPLSAKDLARFAQHWRHGMKSEKQPEGWYSATVNAFYNK